MDPVNYSLKLNQNQEYTWKINNINYTAMNISFGENWEQKFGLFSNITENKKTKIRIASIPENSTDWEIKYYLWNWIDNNSNFNTNHDADRALIFHKNPLNYTERHNLTNLFPFLLPFHPRLYVDRSNLSNFYQSIFYLHNDLSLYVYKDISSLNKLLFGWGQYNDSGIMNELKFILQNGAEYTIFHMILTSVTVPENPQTAGGGGGEVYSKSSQEKKVKEEIPSNQEIPLQLILLLSIGTFGTISTGIIYGIVIVNQRGGINLIKNDIKNFLGSVIVRKKVDVRSIRDKIKNILKSVIVKNNIKKIGYSHLLAKKRKK